MGEHEGRAAVGGGEKGGRKDAPVVRAHAPRTPPPDRRGGTDPRGQGVHVPVGLIRRNEKAIRTEGGKADPISASSHERVIKKKKGFFKGIFCVWTGERFVGTCAMRPPSYPFAIVIPVFNHPQRIPSVAEEALGLHVPVIVVDDGSTDDTPDRLRLVEGITLLRHASNLGKGAALLTGFQAAAPLASWAVTVDGDGQHSPREAPLLFAAVSPGERPIVVGRRQNMAEQPAPWTSRFGRGFSNFWVRCAGGPALADTQSGMRLYPLPEVLALPVKARRFQYEVEVLVWAHRQGIPVREAPVTVHYPPPGQRVSHFRPGKDFLRNATTFTRLVFLRIFLRIFLRLPAPPRS